MADSAVEKQPFGGSWAMDGLSVVYGREERLEGDGLRGSENGHGRGEDEMVVVIEQVLLTQIRVCGLADDQCRDHIGTKLCLFSRCVPVHHCNSPSMYSSPATPGGKIIGRTSGDAHPLLL